MRFEQKNKERFIRYSMLVIGIFLMGTGVAYMVKSRTGTSAVTSLPAILNVIFPSVTLGTFTFLLNMLFFLGQFVAEPGSFSPAKLLQIIPTVLLGVAVDVNMWLADWINPVGYGQQLLLLLCGVLLFGLSIALMLSAHAVLMPIDSFVSAIAKKLGAQFGNVKTGLDITLVLLSVVVSLCVLHRLEGVREGTVIAAVFVGQISRLLQRYTDRLLPWMMRNEERTA